MLFNLLKIIYNHPYNKDNKISGLIRFIKWQISCRLNPYPIVYPYTENSKLILWKGLKGATANIYCGLIEYEDMAFLLHFLRPNDLFIDIGANVGVYTLLASAEIKANTIAIEPIPATFKNLNDNILINQIQERVQALNIGLGSQHGKIKFTKAFDTVNHVATEFETDTIEVDISTLDSVLQREQTPALIKIDVEGFETEVLKGGKRVLSNPSLKAIIIELNGSGDRYGYDEQLIHQNLLSFGFKTYKYNPVTRELISTKSFGIANTIYLRDEHFVFDRVKIGRKVRIGHIEI